MSSTLRRAIGALPLMIVGFIGLFCVVNGIRFSPLIEAGALVGAFVLGALLSGLIGQPPLPKRAALAVVYIVGASLLVGAKGLYPALDTPWFDFGVLALMLIGMYAIAKWKFEGP